MNFIRVYLLAVVCGILVAAVLAGCVTTAPRMCSDYHRDVSKGETAARRALIDRKQFKDGQLFVYSDEAMNHAQMHIYSEKGVTDATPPPPIYQKKGECVQDEKTYEHWSATVPIIHGEEG